MSRRLMELLTYAQVNKEFFNGDANQFRTRYIIAESDLRSIYQEIFGRELSKAYDETLSLEETPGDLSKVPRAWNGDLRTDRSGKRGSQRFYSGRNHD